MKKILILILFLPLLGCGNIIKNKETSINFNCPRVFFSSEDRVYIDNSISFDDITIKAELNNFAIKNKCQIKENIAVISLDVLIVAKPMDNLEESSTSFPVYVSILDSNDETLETQYFSVLGKMKKDPETNSFTESDITDQLQIVTKYLNASQFVLGFMLDNKKRELLN